MLFLSDEILESKDQLITDLDGEHADREAILNKILDLDPDDNVALATLANLRSEAGDFAGAEALLWRAIESQPCAWAPYEQLAILLKDQEPLAKGLFELACRFFLCDLEALEDPDEDLQPIDWENAPALDQPEKRDRWQALADWLRGQRAVEPAAVTERLAHYRLIEQLRDTATLDQPLVDAFLKAGSDIVPLLVGVLRGWASELLEEEEVDPPANSLALLGEIGDPTAIPAILEMAALIPAALSGAGHWALDRIVAQHPLDAARVMADIAPSLDATARIAIAESLLTHPAMDPNGVLIERLFLNLEAVDPEARGDCFQILLSLAIMVRGKPGLEVARGMLRRHGALLSRNTRRECDEMIAEYAELPLTPPEPPEPSPWTVYQICRGEVDWEEEMKKREHDADIDADEEDYYPTEPLRKPDVPGRNDPCWCGSGKKYKKCHLETDAARAN